MPPPGRGAASSRCGPASFAGTSRIRFGGSVAGATLSARSRSPEAVFSCANDPTIAVVAARSGPWLEIGDRVFTRRYRFFDQQVGVVLGGRDVMVIDTRISE